jgi:hypothetical protein
MARPKQQPKTDTPATDERTVVVHLKGSTAYAQWLDEASEKTHIAKSVIIRLALAEWAQKNSLPSPPKM